jgi:hypothetical protein
LKFQIRKWEKKKDRQSTKNKFASLSDCPEMNISTFFSFFWIRFHYRLFRKEKKRDNQAKISLFQMVGLKVIDAISIIVCLGSFILAVHTVGNEENFVTTFLAFYLIVIGGLVIVETARSVVSCVSRKFIQKDDRDVSSQLTVLLFGLLAFALGMWQGEPIMIIISASTLNMHGLAIAFRSMMDNASTTENPTNVS